MIRIIQAILKALKPPVEDRFYDAEPTAHEMYSLEVEQVKTLFISAGHSDTDSGAVGHGYTEAQIVTEFRDLVAEELRKLGVEFSKDGEKGQNLPLRKAVQMASSHDIAVEWHCNAFTNPSATGTETLCADPANQLSNELCAVTSEVLAIRDRGAKAEGSGQHSRLAFVSTGKGIIHELFFITNENDLAAYQRNKYKLAKRIAQVLAVAVCD